jgi:hypothetical protein
MADLKLSLPERALLMILMATNAELSNPEIKKKYGSGLQLTKAARLKLVDAKIIDCHTGKNRTNFFRLAEQGWAWCREELAHEAQKDDGSGGKALYAVLGGLGSYLDRTGRSLAQIFADLPEEPDASDAPVASSGASASPAARALPADEIDLLVRRTYRRLAKPAGSWVGLADIREHLGDIPRAEVDGVLRLMARMPGIHIEEETNQKSLTRRDREAAVTIGNRAQHVLSIESA